MRSGLRSVNEGSGSIPDTWATRFDQSINISLFLTQKMKRKTPVLPFHLFELTLTKRSFTGKSLPCVKDVPM